MTHPPVTSAASQPSRARRSSSRKPSATRTREKSNVQVSAVISTYLLTHLHHVLQRAEYAATQEGRHGLAANYAQLRQVLCLDARSMEAPSAEDPDAMEHSRAA